MNALIFTSKKGVYHHSFKTEEIEVPDDYLKTYTPTPHIVFSYMKELDGYMLCQKWTCKFPEKSLPDIVIPIQIDFSKNPNLYQ